MEPRDRGMTLIELLVSVGIIGLIATVIAAAITVTLRQAPETTARVDVARWEQNLGTWLPTDLASAVWPVDTAADPDVPDDPAEAVENPAYKPCPDVGSICDFGENIAHFSWTDGVDVDVSYRYGQAANGTYELRRVECRGTAPCSSITLARDVPPSAGGDAPISVTFPPDVESTLPNGSPAIDSSGRRVTVAVTGLNGTDLLTFAGGGIARSDLQPAAIQPPEFLQARSGCGGPITVVVDESGSISPDGDEVIKGVKSFVSAFAGTPTQLQIVGFNNKARVLDQDPADGGTPWNYWFDLADQATVNLLLGGSSPIDDLKTTSGTNWEDGLYRAFYSDTGGAPAVAPELVVFFTDGLPTRDRDSDAQTGAEAPEAGAIPSRYDAEDDNGGSARFSPVGWYRSQWLLQQTSTRVIGLGVGDGFQEDIVLNDDTELNGSQRNEWTQSQVPAKAALGDLIADNDLSAYDGTDRFVEVQRDESPPAGQSGWDATAVENADILTTTNFEAFGSALETIALNECGGTLSVQTRRASDGSAVGSAVTYEVSGVGPLTEATTSALNKTAAFDIASEDGSAVQVLLKPRTLDGTGFTADDWTCRSRNAEITDPSKLSPAGPGAEDGVNITVAANEAVSCVLTVVPS